jgi:class 3 adenylate cyclase
MSETRKLAAILVADVVGFSRLASIDEERTLSRLRGLRGDLIDPAVSAHHGRIVKRTGDGALVEFRSVVDAVRCAIEVQTGMAERNAGVSRERRIEFRIGVHLGDVVEEMDGDLMGDGVNIAARLESIAKPGTICLSEDAYRQVKRRLDLKVSDLGAARLKNIAAPVRAYLVEDKPPKRWSTPRHQLLAPMVALGILVVAGAAGWNSIPGKSSTTASLTTTPSMSANSSTTPAASPSEPIVPIMPAAGNQPIAPSHPEAQRQEKPVWNSQPDSELSMRKAAHSLAKRQPSSKAESVQSPSAGSASISSQPCYLSAAQMNGNHQSCEYLRGLPQKPEPVQSPAVESASSSSQPCYISVAQMNGNHQSCEYLRGY